MLPRTLVLAALVTLVPALSFSDDGAPSPPPLPGEAPQQVPAAPKRIALTATVGAAALPSTDLSVMVAQGGVNFATERTDVRLTGVLYSATGDNDSSGFGLALEQRWHFGERYSPGLGVLLASHTISHDSSDDESTAMIGILATPVMFRLGERKAWEVGLTAFAMREFAYDTVTPGFYLSAGYCGR